MRLLSADQILQIWEIGQAQHPLDRALTLLSFALPERSLDDLAQFSIGQRDALLLTLREMTFGSVMDGFAVCPQCGEQLEFTLKVKDLRIVEPMLTIKPEYAFSIEDYTLQFRLPNSRDLAAVVRSPDLVTAHRLLAQRCIQQVSLGGEIVKSDTLPDAVLNQLGQYMADCDPQAELLLDLTCPACNHRWQVLFDIVSFFWIELGVQAKRLLREVHTLARSYGWRESDILSMSPMRRQFYLDLVSR
ncbi:phage baseplate protein [Komarekiella sp. 'clone 1']|uniref:Phage baseplate protein n=1 Tax=Komarekiella delphini-convector SJRDD-AB1 TaxID=2593771 RepID=A0AA40T098_9NOST|nr:phage baseplate protein [Komarekiella delphini-convector]MBD6618235.1 phage baseplate protein [Komarekiella delphini-convector SJRDD-AB1]